MEKNSVIIKPVEKEMERFIKLYEESLQGHNTDFQSMIDYVLKTDGKKIRPLILLLSAKICGQINEKTIDYAIVMELLHTATLIHDDVVDDTKQRRGKPSLNATYDNRGAVLLGDYILSISIVRAVMSQSLPILGIISRLALNLAEGELRQWAIANGNMINESYYYDIIRKKTAVLLSSCTEIGALSVGANKETIEIFRLFGEYLGICFQIKDDLFDYYKEGETGKPTGGNDIREGKITLPLIHAFNSAPKEKADLMIHVIKNEEFTEENINMLIDFAIDNGGIEYAKVKMNEIKEKALSLLSEFPESEAKNSMINLVDYIIERKK